MRRLNHTGTVKGLLISALALSGLTCRPAAKEPITAWFAPSALKVMRDARPAAEPPLRWDLAAARSEVEGCQLVLLSGLPVRGVTVSVSGLSSGRTRLEASLFKVAYVPCRREKILYPDPLPPLTGAFDLEPGQAQPVWISVRVPKDARPGVYKGTVEVRTASRRRRFPLSVRVWDFALPDTPACQTAFGISYEMAADFEGVKLDSPEGRAMAGRYYEYMLAHRASPMLLPVDLASPEAVPYLDDPRMTSFLIPIGKKSDEELASLIRHLQDGGRFSKGYFYEVDEPITKPAFDALAAYTDRLRRIEPRYRAVTPFWGNPDWDPALKTADVMLGRVNIWCPHYLYFDAFPEIREFLKRRRSSGETTWWYICNNPRRSMNNIQIDMPAVPHRVLFWQQKREGLQGFLFWSINYWSRRYIQDPWLDQDVLDDDLYGDGSLVYPGAKAGVPGPVGSLRMEVIRDGLEDFDYFALAEERLGAGTAMAFVTRIARSLKDFDDDPLKLEAVRRELGAAIEKASAGATVRRTPVEAPADRVLRYDRPAQNWNEALPVGNGRLGAMVFGTVPRERIQFNEDTLWQGGPHDYSHPGASDYLPRIRELLFAGKPREAEELAMQRFMSVPLGQMAYQPFGDIGIEFPGHENYSGYERVLDISRALSTVRYKVDGTTFTREVFASYPDQVIVVRLTAGRKKALSFKVTLDSPHGTKSVKVDGPTLTLNVAVKDGALNGVAMVRVETDGEVRGDGPVVEVSGAGRATLILSAATNFVSYEDVGGDAAGRARTILDAAAKKPFAAVRDRHIADHRSLFDRFDIDFGSNGREGLTTDRRLRMFPGQPEDPGLIALYVQYGRYLMIASSRPGGQPANLQGLWNQDLDPAWGSKYTTNINAEMNYWPTEVTNLAECQEPFFRMVEDCARTGRSTAKVHYGADGWVLHHNTDLWRGTAPINHSNHGMWMGGSGWVSRHLWEHFLFTRDMEFLRGRAWPVMREAARFYSQVLVPDPRTGRLISTPSNSPEIGGMVAGPTMDHQIIRSLFTACVEASALLGEDREFAAELARLIPRIAPNRVGRLGQLQEWMDDVDDPNEHHRHVSHLWGVYPGADITWETSPDLMKAARQSLLFRGDEGTGWSLAWKINFWARFLDGDHAYGLLKLLFRVKDETSANPGGGSYINLFDSHPPFQIDGNFGAAAGIVELLVQSHQGFIDVLPALPKALPSGRARGVCARGGFELDLTWKDGRLTGLEILSRAGLPCRVRYHGRTAEFATEKGKRYTLGSDPLTPLIPRG